MLHKIIVDKNKRMAEYDMQQLMSIMVQFLNRIKILNEAVKALEKK